MSRTFSVNLSEEQIESLKKLTGVNTDINSVLNDEIELGIQLLVELAEEDPPKRRCKFCNRVMSVKEVYYYNNTCEDCTEVLHKAIHDDMFNENKYPQWKCTVICYLKRFLSIFKKKRRK